MRRIICTCGRILPSCGITRCMCGQVWQTVYSGQDAKPFFAHVEVWACDDRGFGSWITPKPQKDYVKTV